VGKVKVTRKYQVTIPKEVRKMIGVKIGDELFVSGSERRIILEKTVDLDELAGSWTHIENTDVFMEEVRRMWRTWKLK